MAQEQKKHTIEMTRKRAFAWGLGFVFIMLWMFVLGILVGRGLTPLPIDAQTLKNELEEDIAQSAHHLQKGESMASGPSVVEDQPLDFHEALRKMSPKASYRTQPTPTPKKTVAPASTPSKKRATSAAKAVSSPKSKPKAQPTATPLPETKSADKPVSHDRFTVQVAALKDLDSADRLVKTLRSKGYKAYHVGSNGSGGGRLYRVRVGAFSDRKTAEKTVKRLKTDQMAGFVVSTQ